MEQNEFKKLLYDVACLAVTCDGYIDDKEIRELKFIDKSTSYFKDINLSRKLKLFTENFQENSEETINKVYDQINKAVLNPVEEMLILEIALRLIYSDTKIDKKEITYIQSLKSLLTIDDEMIVARFGAIDFLLHTNENIFPKDKPKAKSIKSEDKINIENIYSNFDDK